MKKGMIALLALAFTLAVVMPALAEDPVDPATQEQKAETKNLRKEIVKLKYVRAQDIDNLLYTYVSRDGRIIQFNPNMPAVLTVSDTPENVEKILAAIRELDVKPADVLYTVQLVLGSEADATTDPSSRTIPLSGSCASSYASRATRSSTPRSYGPSTGRTRSQVRSEGRIRVSPPAGRRWGL